MKRLAIAALMLGVAGALAPASAQYYGGGGYGPGYGPPPEPPPYGRRGYGGRGGYDDPPPGYGRGGGGYGPPPPRRGSSICVTSRGSCPIGGVVPRNSPCGCEIPGFGYKRGAAG